MGYYTQYSLIVIDGDQDLIRQFREENENAKWALQEDGSCEQECKWYNSTQELEEFSKKHPEALFQMDGIGEEDDDIWSLWCRNGKSYQEKAVIIYPVYDETKLK